MFRIFIVFFLIANVFSSEYKESKGMKCPGKKQEHAGAYMFATYWGASYCELFRNPHCKNNVSNQQQSLTLHGLWPNQCYCGIKSEVVSRDKFIYPKGWSHLEELNLPETIKEKMLTFMPSVDVFLHRHEWIKHGSCSGLDKEKYFSLSLAIFHELNKSYFGEYLKKNVGGK